MTSALVHQFGGPAVLAGLLLVAGPAASAQQPGNASEPTLHFEGLERKADEVVQVNLWGRALEQAKKGIGLHKNVTAKVRSFVNGLTGVYRRTYRFRRARTDHEDVKPVHRRLTEGGWVPLVATEDRRKPESLAVYSIFRDEEVAGMTVVTSAPSEVTVLKILGPMDFEALSAIGSGMGLPVMRVATTEIHQGKAPAPSLK